MLLRRKDLYVVEECQPSGAGFVDTSPVGFLVPLLVQAVPVVIAKDVSGSGSSSGNKFYC